METKFLHNQANQRFELIVDDKYTAIISYVISDGKLILNHTRVPDELAGQGVGKQLATQAFQLIKSEDLKAVATCSYLVALVERNPEWNFIEV